MLVMDRRLKTVQIDAQSRVRRQPSINEIVEDVIGCKWTLHVLARVRAGVRRPGQLVRTADGLTTKVLNERLAKLVRYGVLENPLRACASFSRKGAD